MKLKELIIHLNINGSGKNGTDKDCKHSYLPEYEKLFSGIKDEELKILEIGIQFGGSSLLWQEYFKNSILTLIDIEYQITENIKSRLSEERCEVLIFDAYRKENLSILKNQYDIIIDDGSHTLESHIFLVKNYLNFLSDNGILVIEDIQDFEHIEILKSLVPEGFEISIIDLREVKERYDDILFVLKKNYSYE